MPKLPPLKPLLPLEKLRKIADGVIEHGPPVLLTAKGKFQPPNPDRPTVHAAFIRADGLVLGCTQKSFPLACSLSDHWFFLVTFQGEDMTGHGNFTLQYITKQRISLQ